MCMRMYMDSDIGHIAFYSGCMRLFFSQSGHRRFVRRKIPSANS